MKRKLATATVLLLLLVMAGTPAGANAASKDRAHSDLSSLPKIEAYLASIGIDLGTMVVQQGQLNYAGPNCPGAGWNCTTANKVVQLTPAALPAANIVDCSPAVSVTLLGVDECVIVQSSALSLTETASTLNSASCDIDGSSGKQRCKIRQQSKKGSNHAQINQRTNQRGGSPQFAQQEATIDQTSETGNNTAKIAQTIAQDLKTTSTTEVTQQQDACQYAKVSQASTIGGSNSSDVQQSQSQGEAADSSGDIHQFQNTAACQFSDIAVVGERNATADVMQNSTNGNLTSNLRQLITQNQNADSPAGTVTQTQSNSASGGLKGDVTQSTTDPGVIRSTSTEDEPQTQDADTEGPLTQLQRGPEFCCAEQFGGTEANENMVTQSNVQNQTPGSGTSDQSTLQQGFCSETVAGAMCRVTQTYTANGEGEPQSATGMTVNCSRGGEGADFCFGGVD
jgi:hypothetical protein